MAAATTIEGHHFVTLDSLVPTKAYGALTASQLGWLREVLAEPAPHGTTLVLHHLPVTLDVAVQRALALQQVDGLPQVIEGAHVGLILCGHFHPQITRASSARPSCG